MKSRWFPIVVTLAIVAVLMSASILMSASRAGLISLFCEYLLLMLFVLVNKNRLERRIAIAVLTLGTGLIGDGIARTAAGIDRPRDEE